MDLLSIFRAISDAELVAATRAYMKTLTYRVAEVETGIRAGQAYVKASAGGHVLYERFTPTNLLERELRKKKKIYQERQ